MAVRIDDGQSGTEAWRPMRRLLRLIQDRNGGGLGQGEGGGDKWS